jgi:RND superfamily putative drug exporter
MSDSSVSRSGWLESRAARRAARAAAWSRRPVRWLGALGGFCGRHPWLVILAWAALVGAAATGAVGLHERLHGGAGDIAGSPSLRVDRILRDDFPTSVSPSLVFALRSASLERDPDALFELFSLLRLRWFEDEQVADVLIENDVEDRRLLPAPGSGHIAILSLRTDGLLEAEQMTPRLRAAAEPLLREARARHPDLQWALTGRPALTYDLNRFNAEDTQRAELIALPLTLLILILAFRSLVAAGLSLLLALVSTTVTLGLLSMLAGAMTLSNLAQSIAGMVGLALGIDYSLFLIHRYRTAVTRLREEDPGRTAAELGRLALHEAMTQAGAAVFYAGLTVLVGMGALLVAPLVETRSIGLAGCLVVAVTVIGALTLLPALLTLLGPERLEWPRLLSSRLHGARARRRWEWWAEVVTRRPGTAALASAAALFLLAAPGLQTRFGIPEAPFLPPQLEFTRGMAMLEDMRMRGLLSPVPLILTDERGGEALTPERVPALLDFSARLRADPRVAFVRGPVDLAEGWPRERYLSLYRDVDRAMAENGMLRTQFVSPDRTRLLIWAIPRDNWTVEETQALARDIPGWMRVSGLRLDVGGQAQFAIDFDAAVAAAYGPAVGFVVIVSFLVLLLFFRAPLVAAKALILNALSVAAGYGMVVYVFQLGHGSAWLGVSAPTEVVPLTIPLMIFCILFGLSMDYEVFLLSRAKSAFERTGDNKQSIREAVTETGTVITSAALIMAAVFGAFALARVVLVQMLGLGLAVAVLVDATIIRCLLGPALMQLAGRWNWWPSRASATSQAAPEPAP